MATPSSKNRSSLFFCFLLLAGVLSVGRADDSAMAGMSGAPYPMKGHKSIRMVSEVVRCEVPSGKVRAKFTFKNEGPATTVRMGFPERGMADKPPKNGTLMEHFRTYVDGVQTKVTRMNARTVDDQENEYRLWWVKTVKFAKGQTRVIEDDYEGGMGWNTSGDQWFSYVLTTGANWKGTIGDATIIVDIGSLGHVSDLHFARGGVLRNNLVTWKFKNFEPKSDVDVGWFGGYKSVTVYGKSYPEASPWYQDELASPPRFWRGDIRATATSISRLLGTQIVIDRKDSVATLTLGSRRVVLSPGHPLKGSRLGVSTKKTRNGTYIVALVGDVARAFGGKTVYNAKKDVVEVTMPIMK